MGVVTRNWYSPESGASNEPLQAMENWSAVMPAVGEFVPKSNRTTGSVRFSTDFSFLFIPFDWKYSAWSPPGFVARRTGVNPLSRSATDSR